jgi:large subunit ribosomal protein L18Ae
MYFIYRAISLCSCFLQIIRVVEIEKSEDVRRPYIKQLLIPNLKFPLPHRITKARSTFVANRPSTF